MLAKKTNRKKHILPKTVAGAVRAKLTELELNERDIVGAVAWARKPARKVKK